MKSIAPRSHLVEPPMELSQVLVQGLRSNSVSMVLAGTGEGLLVLEEQKEYAAEA
jgi:hypothetical protein